MITIKIEINIHTEDKDMDEKKANIVYEKFNEIMDEFNIINKNIEKIVEEE